ncbi:MAG: zinc ABC transporter substrate-binding protein [Chloroflexota bacterium]|nr:zinc ABC transporter substrate-binding protein [Chloroflexota bacterium]
MHSRVKIAPLLLFTCLSLALISACTTPIPKGGSFSASTGPATGIPIVAAENFYGDLFKQIGGAYVSVTSVLSDPNVDPHQYESSIQNAVTISNASIVIENGNGYDTWMDKLLSASPNADRIVLSATTIAGNKLPDNPHVWYDIHNMIAIAQSMDAALKKVDSAHASTYDRNLQTVIQALTQVIQKMDSIKGRYARTPVGLTEDIFLYQAQALDLNVLTPIEFQKAIAEGNDPPADTVISANNQVSQHLIRVLIYNEQTVTPITTNLENAAQQNHIPVVPVTETMPHGKTYQQWMLDQLTLLEQALQMK